MHKKPLVIIVGAGYGGVRVALDLLKKRAASIILVDPSPYHAFPTHFYELATAFRAEPKGETQRDERHAFHDMLRTAAIPLEDIFGSPPLLKIIRSKVARVEPNDSAVILGDGRRMYYDFLVVAIGSETNYFNIPHLSENAIGLKTAEEALNIRNRIDELFLQTPKHKKITVVVGGGGFTGCELAGELVGYMKKLAHIHGRPTGNWACIIVEAGHVVFGSSSAWVQKNAKRRLLALGVTILTESPIVDVWPGLLYLGKEKRTLAFDLLVWAAGVKGACEGSIITGVALDKKNCVGPNETLRVSPCENIFVVGDVASTLDQRTGGPTRMTAQKAIRGGRYVARAIRRISRMPNARLAPYQPKQSKYIIPLGGKYALLDAGALKFSGASVWALKYVVLARYLVSILSFRKAAGLLWRELALYTRND